MKNILSSFLFLIVLLLSPQLFAQNPTVEIAEVIQKGETIEFSLSSTTQFYVGGNIYILHIGKTEFKLSKQSDEEDKSTLTFFIPLNDFNNLKNKDAIWLTYGNIVKNNSGTKEEIENICKECPRTCWCLG
ncbi:MAG: hypothetical protein H7Y00_17025, partial [Fimbriimonadaceae bacterium]|nr:hypothetical protein [Chitinophagales bacterium]